MEKLKQKMIHGFTEFGKRHRKLAIPVIAILTVCLMGYYMVRGFYQRLCRSSFRRRLACVLLVSVILFTQTDLSSVLASGQESLENDADSSAQDGTAGYTVLGFAELSDEVRAQTVPVGTVLAELSLPSELTVFAEAESSEEAEEEESAEENSEEAEEEESAEENSEEAEEESNTEEGEETAEENVTEDGAETEEESGTEEGEEPAEESGTEEGEETAEENVTEDGAETAEENGAAESAETAEDNGAAETAETEETPTEEAAGEASESFSVTAEESAEGEATAKTVTVEAPVYYAEPEAQAVSVLNRDSGSGETDGQDDAGAQQETISLSVTWQSEPEYDGNTEGEYVFTPVLPEGYALAEGLSLPEIAVTVEQEKAGVPKQSDIEIEVLEPDWDDPETKRNQISAILAVPGEYDSYDWQYFAGEDTREESIDGWVSTGAADETLPLDKGTFMAYAFRCVVGRDGELYATLPYAYDEAALAGPLSDIAAYAWGEAPFLETWKESGTVAVASGSDSRRCFDVYGVENGSYYKTTYRNLGYYIASMVDDSQVNWSTSPNTAVSMGGSLTGTFQCDIVYGGRYVEITYQVKNTGSTAKEFQIGSSADVMIDQNDKAPVVGTSAGLKMEDGAGKVFNLVVPTADTKWYGSFSNAYKNIFTNLEDQNTPYSGDSGMAWSWSGTVQPGKTWERTALIGVGELPASPAAPTIDITLNDGRTYVKPGEKITVSGTATAGTTVYITVGGEEYSIKAAANGSFTKEVTVPADAEAGTLTVQAWAVSSEGGISDTVSKELTVKAGPSVSLTADITTVMQWDSLTESWYQGFIKSSNGTVSHTSLTDAQLAEPGEYIVTYTAKETGFDNETATLTVTVLPHPLEIGDPTAAPVTGASSYTLKAALTSPGSVTIKETGFVWGNMKNPTITMYNGKAATASAVTSRGAYISVTAADLVDGVTYYCRAYATTTDEATYYSAQTSFGIDAKSYGTFTVSGSGNTFTITRAGGTGGAQTVYYRTQNGSAVAGTHYTAAAGTVIFEEGDTSKTVTVTEQGANEVYGSKAATAYSNADRVYFFEIYRVDGGGTLGDTTRVTRTLTNGSSYTVARTLYDSYKSLQSKNLSGFKGVGDGADKSSHNGETLFVNKRGYNVDHAVDGTYNRNSREEIAFSEYSWGSASSYLQNTSDSYLYKVYITATEEEDGYEYIWIGNDTPNNADSTTAAATDGNTGGVVIPYNSDVIGSAKGMYTAVWEMSGTQSYTFPTTSGMNAYSARSGALVDDGVKLGISQKACVYFTANGKDEDEWIISSRWHYAKPYDTIEPKCIGIGATESNSVYRAGDTFYVSLIFDEIVDSTNSTLSNVSVSTSWGNAAYAGGADTNVLYFKGTVSDSASGALTVNSVSGVSSIKDMCSASSTSTNSSITGSTGGNANNTTPAVTVGAISNANGTLSAEITATNCTTLKYAWTQSGTIPVTGWFTADSSTKTTVKTRQSSGTWYLHAQAYKSANGKTVYANNSYTFSESTPVVFPELTLSADNTNWATSRDITVTKSPGTATVKYTGPGVTTAAAVSGSSVTVTQNGVYTFTLTSGEDTVVKQVTVSKIDRANPTAEITEPGEGYLTQSEDVTFTITPGDTGGSGVASVTGTWTKDGSNSTIAAVLTQNSDGTYKAVTNQPEGSSGTWKLTVTVKDNAGNTYTVSSQTYTVNRKVPAVTVTKGSTESNGSVNYTYTIDDNGQTIQSVQLSGGSVTTDLGTEPLNGTFRLTAAGTYYVVVTDTAGHVVRSAEMTVTDENESDPVDGEAPEIRLRQSTEDWVNASTGVTVTVSVTDNIEPVSAAWSEKKQGGENQGGQVITLSVDADAKAGNQAKTGTFTVTANGTYTVTAADRRGNTATEEIEITNIDGIPPTAAAKVDNADWKPSHTVTVTAGDGDSDSNSGVKSVEYAVVSGTSETPSAESLKTLEGTDGGTVTVTENGSNYLYIRVTDNVGNQTVVYSDVIKADGDTPALTFNGGSPAAESLTFTVNRTFGPSGGTVKVQKDGGEEQEITGNTYTVDSGGTYTFTATSNAGLTRTVTKTVYSIAFEPKGGMAVSTRIAADGGVFGNLPTTARTGYVFDGWYTAANGGTKINDDTTVTADQTVYAQWKLAAPTVSVSAKDSGNHDTVVATYTGSPVITLTAEVSHALTQGLDYTYQWYREASSGDSLEPVSGATEKTLSLTDVSQSGGYTVKVAAKETVKSSAPEPMTSEAEAGITVTINPFPMTFTVKDDRYEYDAQPKAAAVSQSPKDVVSITEKGTGNPFTVTYEQNGATVDTPTDAGEYDIMVTIHDGNFQHKDSTDRKAKVGTLTIDKKPISVWWRNLNQTYDGTEKAPEVSLLGIEEEDAGKVGVSVYAAPAEDRKCPVDAGTYTVEAVLTGERGCHYTLGNSKAQMTVNPAEVVFTVTKNSWQESVLQDNEEEGSGEESGEVHEVHLPAVTAAVYGTENTVLSPEEYQITYRDAAGKEVEEPADAGVYEVWAELLNKNFRHLGSVDGTAQKIGVLNIYKLTPPPVYAIAFESGTTGDEDSPVTGDAPELEAAAEGTVRVLPECTFKQAEGYYAFAGWLLDGKLYRAGETYIQPAHAVTFTATWNRVVQHISGKVVQQKEGQEKEAVSGAVVTLMQGANRIAQVTTDENGEYKFPNLPAGLYNLVAERDGVVMTIKVELTDADVTDAEIALPVGKTNSVVVVAPGTPDIIVGNLEKTFDEADEVYTEEDVQTVKEGGTVEIKFTAQSVTPDEATKAELDAASGVFTPRMFLSLGLEKNVTPAFSSKTETSVISCSGILLESVIPLPAELQGRYQYAVYRQHTDEEGNTEIACLTERENEDGEYIELSSDKTTLTIHAKYYSLYAIAYRNRPAQDSAAAGQGNDSVGQGNDSGGQDDGDALLENGDAALLQEAAALPEESPAEAAAENGGKQAHEPIGETEGNVSSAGSEKAGEKTESDETETEESIQPPETGAQEQAQTQGRPFVLFSALLLLTSLSIGAYLLFRKKECKKEKALCMAGAAGNVVLFLLTSGFQGIILANDGTLYMIILLAFMILIWSRTRAKTEKAEETA